MLLVDGTVQRSPTETWPSKESLSVSRILFAALFIIKIYCNNLMGLIKKTTVLAIIFPHHGVQSRLSRRSQFCILTQKDFWDTILELQTYSFSIIPSMFNTHKGSILLQVHVYFTNT